MNWLFGAGNEPEGSIASRIIARIRNSELVADRRTALHSLRQLASEQPQWHGEIGKVGIQILVAVLRTDKDDPDIVREALDILTTITAARHHEPQQPQPGGAVAAAAIPVGITNTELFVNRPDNIACLIDLLELPDFDARYATVQLLIVLLTNKPEALQDGVMNYPAGTNVRARGPAGARPPRCIPRLTLAISWWRADPCHRSRRPTVPPAAAAWAPGRR